MNATTGIVLLMPLTYSMSPIPALTMLMAIYTAGIMGGSYSSILINTPGTSSSVATLFDGYPMTQRGEALKALNTSIFSSVFGGVVSALALLLISPLLARIALFFDSSEYFLLFRTLILLGLFGLSLVASLSENGLAKGFSIGCFGLLVGCVGLAPLSATARYHFKAYLSTYSLRLSTFCQPLLRASQRTEKHKERIVRIIYGISDDISSK